MEKRSCYLCSLDYKLPNKKPILLECCHNNICSGCLGEILWEKKTCPYCRHSFKQESPDEFSLDTAIEERLNFEELGDVTCAQCEKNPGRKATKKCFTCGFICAECYDSHIWMKIFKNHEISTVPPENWSKNLEKALKTSFNCEKHKEKTIGSFCKNCKKAVCEECVMESHGECQSKICNIDQGFEETIKDLQRDLDIDVNGIERILLEKMKKQESDIENIKRETTDFKFFFKRISKETETEIEDRTKRMKDVHDKTKEDLQMIKHIHGRLHSFVKSAPSLYNKVGILQQAQKVRESIASLQNNIKKTEEEMEPNLTLENVASIKEFFTKIHVHLYQNKIPIFDFALLVNELCDRIHSSYCQNDEKIPDDDMARETDTHTKKEIQSLSESFVATYQVTYDRTMFPRFKYHWELIQKIIYHEQNMNAKITANNDMHTLSQIHNLSYERTTDKDPEPNELDAEIGTKEVSKVPQSTILVYGGLTEENMMLLNPLELQESVGNDQDWEDVILIVFNNSIDGDWKTLGLNKEQMIKCRWCLIVSLDTKSEKLRDDLVANNITNFSVVPPDSDAVWNHLTSAMELPLIEILKEKKKTLKSSANIFEDVETVLRRIEKCSDFSKIKNENKSHDIPHSIKDNLKRFEGEIIRYGFHFDHFRVVVKNEKYEDVKEALMASRSDKFCQIDVIRQDDFNETVVPFNGNLRGQGMKLFQSTIAEQGESSPESGYGTLGSLALLNNEKTVALSCGHVCIKDKIVYIENERKERIALGKCLYVTGEALRIQSDLAIVGVQREVEKHFPEKKLLNHMGEPTSADVLCVKDKLDIRGEIVHKLGATSEWTMGKIVSSEIVENVQGVITVKGMNGKEFGRPGDSGSIVFRESPNARERKLEVVAVLSAGKFDFKDQTAGEDQHNTTQKLVLCSVFKDALEQIRKNNDSVESVEFFNDKVTE